MVFGFNVVREGYDFYFSIKVGYYLGLLCVTSSNCCFTNLYLFLIG